MQPARHPKEASCIPMEIIYKTLQQSNFKFKKLLFQRANMNMELF